MHTEAAPELYYQKTTHDHEEPLYAANKNKLNAEVALASAKF